MKVRPLDDKLLVQRFEAEGVTKGGLVLPDEAKKKPMRAKVLATGPGKLDKDGKRVPLSVKIGDTVILTMWAGTEIRDLDTEAAKPGEKAPEHLIITEADVLGIVDE